MTETTIVPVPDKEVEARAVQHPQDCPCGGQYIVVARGKERSVMHSNPPCEHYRNNDMQRYVAWAARAAQNPDEKPPPPPKLNRRQRRAQAAVQRKGNGKKTPRRKPVTIGDIEREFIAGGGTPASE